VRYDPNQAPCHDRSDSATSHFKRRGRMKRLHSFVKKAVGFISKISELSWIIIIIILVFTAFIIVNIINLFIIGNIKN